MLSRRFEKDISFIKRSYALSEELKPVSSFQRRSSNQRRNSQSGKKEVFQKDFRRQEDFVRFFEEKALKELFEKSHEVFVAVEAVLKNIRRPTG